MQSFSIWTTYVLVLYFIVICSSHADRKDTADGTEESFVSRRAALNDTNGVRTGAHDAEWEAGLSLSLSLAPSE